MKIRLLLTGFSFSLVLMLLACSSDEETVTSTPKKAAPAPQLLNLVGGAISCPDMGHLVKTLNYLRNDIGPGELSGNCSITPEKTTSPVLVKPEEFQRLAQGGATGDKLVAWQNKKGDVTGWTTLFFLKKPGQRAYPISTMASNKQNRIAAYFTLRDLQRQIEVSPGSQESRNRQMEARKYETIQFLNVDKQAVQIHSLATCPNHLGTSILCARWSYKGKRKAYWSRLVDIQQAPASRAKFATTLAGY